MSNSETKRLTALGIKTREDFLKLTDAQLLGFWLHHQTLDMMCDPEDFDLVIASFNEYGREYVATILAGSEEYHNIAPVEEKMNLLALQNKLKNIRDERDFRVFEVLYVKKDGTPRKMTCHFKPPKQEKDNDNLNPDLMLVWDIEAEPRYTLAEQTALDEKKMEPRPKGGYKFISMSGLKQIKTGIYTYTLE